LKATLTLLLILACGVIVYLFVRSDMTLEQVTDDLREAPRVVGSVVQGDGEGGGDRRPGGRDDGEGPTTPTEQTGPATTLEEPEGPSSVGAISTDDGDPTTVQGPRGGDDSETAAQAEAAAARARARESAARRLMALVRSDQNEGDHEAAYRRARSVVRAYGDTPSAAEAEAIVDEYEADPDFHTPEQDDESRAQQRLALAELAHRSGREDVAKRQYQSLIDEFPETEAARKARRALADFDIPR